MATLTLAKALNQGLRACLEDDPKALIMGEDVGKLGGVFRITDGLQKDFGDDRVIDTPLAESGIIGTAIGLAIRGFRPICEIQFDGFVFPAFDQIVTQLAKMHYRSGGRVTLPVTIRIPYGGGIGAVEHHSESPEAYFCHTPGLRVVTCATPADGYTMIRQAVRSDDPVIFLEPKRRYWEKGEVDTEVDLFGDGATSDDPGGGPTNGWAGSGSAGPGSAGPGSAGSGPAGSVLGLHRSRITRPGSDVTVVAYGPMVATVLAAAELAARDDQRSLEVIDLRTLSPLDLEPVFASVRRTGRCVVVHEAPGNVSLSAEIAARVTETAFYSLEAPVARVTGFDTPYPPSRLEDLYLPDVDRILDAVDRTYEF